MLEIEEEIVDLQKDFVVYLLFTYGYTEELKKINFYCEEFKEIVKRAGSLSEKGHAYIDQFCKNIQLLLANSADYDADTIRLELVRGISDNEFTKAIITADERYTSTEQASSTVFLQKIIDSCIKKSKKTPMPIQK